ncbi:MAG: hypothetical protein WA077_23245, partial [Anaerolineae bacterium]
MPLPQFVGAHPCGRPRGLVFDPDLGVRQDRFAAAWNGDSACRQMATAQVQAGDSQTYDPALAEILNLVVVPLAFGVAGNALYD